VNDARPNLMLSPFLFFTCDGTRISALLRSRILDVGTLTSFDCGYIIPWI
jgi:hypothetical protein